ncbi:DUF86 domain-containing protein [Mycoplasmatota bacterium]|nr:DUF86 domain-containing protein [Mycoplasmatota bacterium]
MEKKRRSSDVLLQKYNDVLQLFDKYDVIEARIFGSIFKSEDTCNSDVDLIMKLSDKSTLINYGRLKYDLERLLQLPVDILTYSGLNSNILEHFYNNSISITDFADFKANSNKQNPKTKFDKITFNMRSVVWVINRINECCKNISKEEFMSSVLVQDAVTRNIQLLGQVASQMPMSELESIIGVDVSKLKGCIALKEALFMNVDYELLWQTIKTELIPLKTSCEEYLEKK